MPSALFVDRGMRRCWLRSQLAPRVAWRWRAFGLKLHHAHGAGAPDSPFLSKPLHGYIRRGWRPAARLDALLGHYERFAAVFSADSQRSICAGQSLELARLEGRRNARFRIVLAASTTVQTQREGELTLSLIRDGGSATLSRLTFTLVAVDGRIAVAIGGLQGPKPGHKRDIIDATRDLFGLRPKDATLLAARAFSEAIDARSVHSVSDARHVHRRLPDDPKFVSYDAYWRERGAVEGGPFGFVFPPVRPAEAPKTVRDCVKSAVVAGVEAFLAAHRADG